MTEDEAKIVKQLAAESYYQGSKDVIGSIRESMAMVPEGTLLTMEDLDGILNDMDVMVENLFGATTKVVEDMEGKGE